MSKGRISRRLDPRNWSGGGEKGIIALGVIVLLIADLAFAFYIINYSTDEVGAETFDLQEEILGLERHGGRYLIMTSHSVHLLGPGGLTPYSFEGTPVSIAIGDDTGAVAIVTHEERVHYFAPGSFSPTFSVGVEGEASLVGIGEAFDPREYLPQQIIMIVTNETGEHLVLLSIEEGGEVFWSFTFHSGIVCYDRSAGARYVTVGLDDGSLLQFRRLESAPRNVIALEGVPRDIDLSPSGIKQAVLYGQGATRLALFSVPSVEPELILDLPDDAQDLYMQGNSDRFLVRSGDNILEIAEGRVTVRAAHENVIAFMAAPAVHQVFVATGDAVYAYRGERGAPVWRTDTGFKVTGMLTDEGAYLVVLWGGTWLATVDNGRTILGNGTLWAVLGALILGQVIGVPMAIWRRRIVELRTELGYLIIAGLIAGIAISALLPDGAAIEWYGEEVAFHMVAASISVVTAVICWRYEAGWATLVMGFAIGIIVTIPVALTGHFILSLAGHEFEGSAFNTVVLTALTGIKMGLVGGAVGLLFNRIRRVR